MGTYHVSYVSMFFIIISDIGTNLSPVYWNVTEERVVAQYDALKPALRYIDLSQYPANGRGRGECTDKSLCTLTTSTKLYSKD